MDQGDQEVLGDLEEQVGLVGLVDLQDQEVQVARGVQEVLED